MQETLLLRTDETLADALYRPLALALVDLAEKASDAECYRAAQRALAHVPASARAARDALHEGLQLLAEGQLARDAATLRAAAARFAEARRHAGAEEGVVLLSLLAEADAHDALREPGHAAARRLLARRLSGSVS